MPEWSGVRLVDVLKKAGLKVDAAHVQLLGADAPPNPKTPAFFRSIPLARALDPSTILATSMNGEALPLLHGGPIRLVVPTWAGNHWIKWLRKVTVARDEAPGFYMQTGYKIPKVPTPPGVDLKPSDVKSVTTLNVKSLIARPIEGAIMKAGPVEIRGVAWTGEGGRDPGRSPDQPRLAVVPREARKPAEARDLGFLVVFLGRPARPPRFTSQGHRFLGRRPARSHPLESQRLPLECHRPGHLRGPLR